MRNITAITALMTLICLTGAAAAQGISTLGEGYSSSQKAFFNEPQASTFDPYVQSYWNNYVANKQNQSGSNQTSEIDLWMNNFPMLFNTPLQLGSTSFKTNAPTQDLSEKDKNSQALKTEVYRDLGLKELSSDRSASGSLSTSSVNATPETDSAGNAIAQSVMAFFIS